MKITKLLPCLLALGLGSCASIDCQLDSIVVWTLSFYDSETETQLKLPCTLTIDAVGAGTLYNKGQDISSMTLPMSLTAETDTLLLQWKWSANDKTEANNDNHETQAAYDATDVLYVDHTNRPHFDAMDCPMAVFHDITDVRVEQQSIAARPLVIDSVTITRTIVDYHDVENIRLYIHLPAGPGSYSSPR